MTNLNETIDRLAHFAPSPNPVISCFVNTGPDGRGRPTFMTFLKKAFSERLRSFPERTDAVQRIEADRDRILAFLSDELDPAVKAASIHASDADGLWETHTFRTPSTRSASSSARCRTCIRSSNSPISPRSTPCAWQTASRRAWLCAGWGRC